MESDPNDTELYLGGLGTNAKLIWDRVPPEVEPFSPDNLLIFATGLLCGTPAIGCNRTIVTTISPQTKLMHFSMMGGFWAPELKHAGYDKVILRGKSPDLVYIWINNDKVEIRDASHLKGKGSNETAQLIMEELNEPKAQVAAIGLAGKRTAIGDAIGLAVKRLRDQPQENRVLVLLTDGENTAGTVDPQKAADIAASSGVRIYTIGVGADERVVSGFFGKRRVANSELDEPALIAIAEKTGGQYFRARDIAGLEAIYRLLDELEPVSADEEVFRPVHELYMWPLATALILCLLLGLLASGLLQRLRSQLHNGEADHA